MGCRQEHGGHFYISKYDSFGTQVDVRMQLCQASIQDLLKSAGKTIKASETITIPLSPSLWIRIKFAAWMSLKTETAMTMRRCTDGHSE
jgi:hypothetical protein